jgi:hypothetical protein
MTLKDENGETISEVRNAKTIGFDDVSFPLSHIAFRTTPDQSSTSSDAHPASSDTTATSGYSLQSLLFLLQYNNEEYGVYFAECLKARIPFVSLIDKKKILDYLTGITEDVMAGGNETVAEVGKVEESEKKGTEHVTGAGYCRCALNPSTKT